MSGNRVRLGRLIALWLLATVLASAGWTSIPAASANQGKTLKPPSLLWSSYPLKQQQSATEQAQGGFSSPQAGQQHSPEANQIQNALLVSALLAILLAVAAVVLMQSSVPAQVGGFRRARDRAKIRGPGRHRSGAKPPRRTRTRPPPPPPPPLREVTGQPIGEPHPPPTQPVAPEPGDDLLEAPQPKPPSAPKPEPVPKQPAVGEPRRAPTPKHVIDEVHAVPEPDPTGKTEVEPQSQSRRAHQTGASVETCEIRLWRGYVKYQLYATRSGSEQAFAESRYFRLRDKDAPSAAAQRALADLLAELEHGGWTIASDGAIWYQQRLQRLAP